MVNALLVVWLAEGVPWWDDWDVVDWWLRWRAGELELGSWWAPHNEHRIVLPRLLFHLALASGAGLVPLMLLSHALLGATLWQSTPLLRAASARLQRPQRLLFLLASSTFLLSWVQWLNVLTALNVAWSGAALGGVLAVRGMVDAPGRAARWRLCGGLALAYLSCAVWLALVSVVLAWQAIRLWGRREATGHAGPLLRLAGLTGGLGALVAIYLRGLQMSPPVRAPTEGLSPAAVGEFVLRLYGSPFTVRAGEPWMGIGLAMGALFLLGTAALLGVAWARRGYRAARPPALGVGLLALAHGAALLIALGRSAHAGEAALASRYTPFLLLGWVALLAWSLGVAPARDERRDAPRGTGRMALAVVALLVFGVAVGAARLWRVASWRQPRLATAHACLREVVADPRLLPGRRGCLAPLYPDAERLVAIARRLAEATGDGVR